MSPTTQSAEIQALIEDFTNQLSNLVRRSALEQVLGALEGGSSTRKPGRRASTSTVKVVRMGRAPKGGRRSSEDVTAMGETLLGYVKKNPGQRGEQIAKALRTDVGTMRLPMKTLIAAKKIKTKGQRRGMTYFAS